ncbi:E3 ubiquitin-protein ligase FANCL-like [Dermacentor silvarum]|uniref:E3 ubiquitin-protein ligase FANCL-like n=1 Tax=Dermacentor silvarum TaxID=543639 RepID=UPI001896D38A|nr:E3 ubiquitin-protein ligase FANCL-like [Dermacentor silvarum]
MAAPRDVLDGAETDRVDSEILKRFPLLLPLNESCTEYKGFLKILDEDFFVHLSIGDVHNPDTYCLSGDWDLQQLMISSGKNFDELFSKCKSASHFLMEFCNMMEIVLQSRKRCRTFDPAPEIFSRIMADVEHCGWENLEHINMSGDEIHLKYIDQSKRKHVLKIHFSEAFPVDEPMVEPDLPIQLEFYWNSDGTLKQIYEKFKEEIERLQEFWAAMDDLDSNCWVLDPASPRHSDCYRRIALGKNVSVAIVVQPRSPKAFPRLEFCGPHRAVSAHEEAVEQNKCKWDSNGLISANLASLLSMELPSRSCAQPPEDVDCACGICYSYLLEGHIPDKLCQSSRCNKPFHQSCLAEWMRSLPSVRQNFNMFFGECPYCSEPMSCKM